MFVFVFGGTLGLVVWVVWLILLAVACAQLAHEKDRIELLWFVAGLLLGPIPLVVLVFLPDLTPQELVKSRRTSYGGRVTCPRCGLIVPYGPACPRCASPLPPPAGSPAGLTAARVDPASAVAWHAE